MANTITTIKPCTPHPTAIIMQKQINTFLWLGDNYKPIDLKNEDAPYGPISYFVADVLCRNWKDTKYN